MGANMLPSFFFSIKNTSYIGKEASIMTFNFLILAICSYILISIFFYKEIKTFVKEKKEKEINIYKALIRNNMNIDVK